MDAITFKQLGEKETQGLLDNPDKYRVPALTDEECEDNIAFLSSGFSGVLNPDWTTYYSEIKDDLKTGDVVLVHGKYPFSWVVTLLQLFNNWGHAAMVIRASDIDPKNQFGFPELLLWESNTKDLKVPNLWRGKHQGQVKEGPMLIDLESRLKNSQSCFEDVKIAFRRLEAPKLNFDYTKLHAVFDEYIDCTFPSDPEVIHSIWLGRKFNRCSDDPLAALSLFINFKLGIIVERRIDIDSIEKLSAIDVVKNKLYCTELLAATFKRMGLITNHHVSNAYSPKDFSSDGRVRFLKRGWLGDEIFIDMLK